VSAKANKKEIFQQSEFLAKRLSLMRRMSLLARQTKVLCSFTLFFFETFVFSSNLFQMNIIKGSISQTEVTVTLQFGQLS